MATHQSLPTTFALILADTSEVMLYLYSQVKCGPHWRHYTDKHKSQVAAAARHAIFTTIDPHI
jgi:hypothetical protein